MKLRNELEAFWQWAVMTPEIYAQTPDYGTWEINYERWDQLYQAASEAIELANINEMQAKSSLDLLLHAISIDKEYFRIIDECVKKLNRLQSLCEMAINHIQPNARCEIARLLGRNKIKNAENLLLLLYRDKTDFVRYSALDSLCRVSPGKAEILAIGLLSNPDELARIFAFRILLKCNSAFLPKARELLKNEKWAAEL